MGINRPWRIAVAGVGAAAVLAGMGGAATATARSIDLHDKAETTNQVTAPMDDGASDDDMGDGASAESSNTPVSRDGSPESADSPLASPFDSADSPAAPADSSANSPAGSSADSPADTSADSPPKPKSADSANSADSTTSAASADSAASANSPADHEGSAGSADSAD